jgi:hypothetical protein
MDCRPYTARRSQCHSIYGKLGEECLDEELTEKRCLSLHHCPQQAKEYYGPVPMVGKVVSSSSSLSSDLQQQHPPSYMYEKALCSSWAEAFAYDQELEYGPRIANHHQDARRVVNADNQLRKQCRQIAFDLATCLRKRRVLQQG